MIIEDGVLNVAGNVDLVNLLVKNGIEWNILSSIVKSIERRPDDVVYLNFKNGKCENWCSGQAHGRGPGHLRDISRNGRSVINAKDFLASHGGFAPDDLFEM